MNETNKKGPNLRLRERQRRLDFWLFQKTRNRQIRDSLLLFKHRNDEQYGFGEMGNWTSFLTYKQLISARCKTIGWVHIRVIHSPKTITVAWAGRLVSMFAGSSRSTNLTSSISVMVEQTSLGFDWSIQASCRVLRRRQSHRRIVQPFRRTTASNRQTV